MEGLERPTAEMAETWEYGVEPGLTLRGGIIDRGRSTLIHFLPGTAFACRLYWPFLSRLAEHYDLFWHDLHGHGESDDGGLEFRGWRFTVDAATAMMDRFGLRHGERRIVGMGHSYGGCMTLIMAAERPELFGQLLLTDPFMVPESREVTYRSMMPTLVQRTRQRNPVWSDEAAVRSYLKARLMFQDWHEEAVDAFIRYNMSPTDSGQLQLKCPPVIEAGVYDDVVDALWPSVDVLQTPTVILSGDRTVPFFREGHDLAARINPHVGLIRVAGGHNFMQERPEIIARQALDVLGASS
ncbi:MAG: alpha/beta hydrolase [Pseudomonadota bacterium]|nr:alpha/beta hydrolase [Pseudomonadota bacterium]